MIFFNTPSLQGVALASCSARDLLHALWKAVLLIFPVCKKAARHSTITLDTQMGHPILSSTAKVKENLKNTELVKKLTS